MDRTIDPAAAQKGVVGRVDEGVHRQCGYIGLLNNDAVHAVCVLHGALTSDRFVVGRKPTCGCQGIILGRAGPGPGRCRGLSNASRGQAIHRQFVIVAIRQIVVAVRQDVPASSSGLTMDICPTGRSAGRSSR